MKTYAHVALVTLFSALVISGCGTYPTQQVKTVDPNQVELNLVTASYNAVDKLIEGQNVEPRVSEKTLILVSTIQNLDNLNSSSTLGSLLSEQIRSKFAQLGVPVHEVRLRGNMYVSNPQGEMMLSREVRDISIKQKADLILVGTYAKSSKSVYVSLKLVRPEDSRITSAYDFVLPKANSLDAMLGN